MPNSPSVRAVSIFPSATAMPMSALMKLLRTEWVQNVRAVSPHDATTLPRVTIMKAADPADATFVSSAAIRSADQPSAWTDAAVSHESFLGEQPHQGDVGERLRSVNDESVRGGPPEHPCTLPHRVLGVDDERGPEQASHAIAALQLRTTATDRKPGRVFIRVVQAG